MYSRNTKTTNEPTASNNKLDRPVKKSEDLGHLKDLKISKYERFVSLERP
jgi:hypothetical protein